MKTQDIYPGMFVPEKETEKIKLGDKSAVKPAINIKETDEFICIDMMIPGVKRESFQISLNDSHLEINVMYDQKRKNENHFQVQEYDIVTYRRKIKLPQNADSAFIQAQYKEGVLSIIVPKSSNPIEFCQEQVFVY